MNKRSVIIDELLEMYKEREQTLKDMIYYFDLSKPNKNKRIFSSIPIIHAGVYYGTYLLYYPKEVEQIKNEYRKFIEESKYGRVGVGRRTLSIQRVQLTKNNRNII